MPGCLGGDTQDLASFFYRQAGKHGKRKAIIAVPHKILVIAFCMLRDDAEYIERGGNYFDMLNPQRSKNRLVRRL